MCEKCEQFKNHNPLRDGPKMIQMIRDNVDHERTLKLAGDIGELMSKHSVAECVLAAISTMAAAFANVEADTYGLLLQMEVAMVTQMMIQDDFSERRKQKADKAASDREKILNDLLSSLRIKVAPSAKEQPKP